MSKEDTVSLQQKFNHIQLIKYWYFGSLLPDYVPIHPNKTFAIIITQLNNMQGEHWRMIGNFRHKLYFEDPLGQELSSFLKQRYRQLMSEPLKYPSVFAVSTRYVQLIVSSSSDKKELLEFTMVVYFLLLVTTCNNLSSLM